MDDQGLSEKTFEEPLSVKSLDCFQVVGGLDTVVEPVQGESAHVNRGGCGSQDDDEAEEVFDVPTLRHDEVFGVHSIPRDGNLTDVVQDVLDQDLKGGHGLKGEPAGSNQDGEYIAKV